MERGQSIRKIENLKKHSPVLSWCRNISAPYLIVSSGMEKGSVSLHDIRLPKSCFKEVLLESRSDSNRRENVH